MDDQVVAAMARWPNVPAVRGWLSLSARGQWRLHPHGRGWGAPDEAPGEAITSPQIVAFIGRNYLADDTGRWFFQNGPQRVYVQLEATPWILGVHRTPQGFALETHTGQPVKEVTQAWVDEDGRLFLATDIGLGLVRSTDMDAAADAVMQGVWQPQPAQFSTLPARYGYVLEPRAPA